MHGHIAKRLVQMLIQAGKNPGQCKVLVQGITFKENVADIRNSKVANLIRELMQFSVNVHLVDPYASPNEVAHEYKLTMVDQPADNYDAVLVAVAHDAYKTQTPAYFKNLMNGAPLLVDVKSIYNRTDMEKEGIGYWRL